MPCYRPCHSAERSPPVGGKRLQSAWKVFDPQPDIIVASTLLDISWSVGTTSSMSTPT
jgi:hypothetical protein